MIGDKVWLFTHCSRVYTHTYPLDLFTTRQVFLFFIFYFYFSRNCYAKLDRFTSDAEGHTVKFSKYTVETVDRFSITLMVNIMRVFFWHLHVGPVMYIIWQYIQKTFRNCPLMSFAFTFWSLFTYMGKDFFFSSLAAWWSPKWVELVLIRIFYIFFKAMNSILDWVKLMQKLVRSGEP